MIMRAPFALLIAAVLIAVLEFAGVSWINSARFAAMDAHIEQLKDAFQSLKEVSDAQAKGFEASQETIKNLERELEEARKN